MGTAAAIEDVTYVRDVLPGLTVFALGLALMVASLTSTVLAAAPDEHAGLASGVVSWFAIRPDVLRQ